MDDKIKELKEEHERLIKESNNHRRLFKELAAKAIEVENRIIQIERDSKYKALTQGSILRFKDEDNEIIQCRLVCIGEKYCDLMVESGNEFYPAYSIMGYKCRYVDTLIDIMCKEHELELEKTINYDDIEE